MKIYIDQEWTCKRSEDHHRVVIKNVYRKDGSVLVTYVDRTPSVQGVMSFSALKSNYYCGTMYI